MSEMFDPKSAFKPEPQAQPTQPTPPTQPIQPTQPTQRVTTDGEDDYEDVAQTIEVGQKVSDYPINKFKAIKGKVSRIAILTRKWKAVKSHFEDGLRNFYCFDGDCCLGEGGRARRRYLVPILVYETDVKGQKISDKVSVQYLVLSGKDYEPLSLIDQSQALNTIDLNIICEDEKYQKKSFIPVPGQALWLQDEAFKNKVIQEYKRVEPFILKAFARKLGKTPKEAQEMYTKLKKEPGSFNQISADKSAVHASSPQSPTDPTSGSFDIDSYLQGN